MATTICHASLGENGKITGGQAGDQNGKEVFTRTWYSKPWNLMLRYKDQNIAKQAAAIAVKLANSNLVGYDQNSRNTLYQALKANNFNVDKYIASGKKTETDCSAFMYACYCCVIPAMRADGNAPTTSTMKAKYVANGFTAYTTSNYLTTDANLKVGDVLDRTGVHTVMVVATTNAAAATPTTTSATSYSKTLFIKDLQKIFKIGITGKADTATFNSTITLSRKKNNTHGAVRPVQKYLNGLGYNCGEADGSFGPKTEAGVQAYQRAKGCIDDGIITARNKTWKKLLGLV